MGPPTDAELLAEADTSATAFADLVERHQARLARYATRRLGPDQAADIVNETFAVAYAKRDRYHCDVADAGPWLLGIATNLIRRHARSETRMLRALAEHGVDPAAPEITPRGIDRQVAVALAGLRRQYRDVLFLHAVAGLSHDEIAAALGVPVGTARGWLTRARSQAAAALERQGVTRTARPEPDAKVSES